MAPVVRIAGIVRDGKGRMKGQDYTKSKMYRTPV